VKAPSGAFIAFWVQRRGDRGGLTSGRPVSRIDLDVFEHPVFDSMKSD